MGHEAFSRGVERAIRPILLRQHDRGELRVRMKLNAAADDIPWPVNFLGRLSLGEEYVQRLHLITAEVLESYEAMRNVEVYLGRYPFSWARIGPSAYIRFHLESYFNEMYILQERMKAFTRRLGREFRKDPGVAPVDDRVKYVIDEVTQLFEPLHQLRGQHVHRTRYDEPELRRLSVLEMVAEADREKFQPLLRRVARAARANILTFVKTTNAAVSDKLDRFFDFFEGLVFKKDGSVRIPSNLRTT